MIIDLMTKPNQIKNSLVKALFQAAAIRKNNTKAKNLTLSPEAIKLWENTLQKNFQKDCEGINVSLSLFLEGILWQCQRAIGG